MIGDRVYRIEHGRDGWSVIGDSDHPAGAIVARFPTAEEAEAYLAEVCARQRLVLRAVRGEA